MRRGMMINSLLPLLYLTSRAHAAAASVVSTITETATAASNSAAAASTQYTSSSAFETAMLNGHNFYRAEHNASALTWNTTSASYASTWSQKCAFKHSGGPTGENLAAGYSNATATVDAWGGERASYDFGHGGFSETTGHFTQVVWKATTTVGCARTDCGGDDATPGWYVVCEYYPPGNVVGAFQLNVQAQIEGPKDGDVEQGLAGRAPSVGARGCRLLAVFCCAVAVAAVLW